MTRRCAGLVAAVLWVGGCGQDPPPGKKPPAPKGLSEQRLHAAGELRLTSAGTEPRLQLRYRLTEGLYQGYRTRVRVKHEAAGQTSTLTALLDWERRITRVDKGWGQAQVQVRRVRLARPPSIRDDVVKRLRGLSLTFDVDPRGRARSTATRPPQPAPLSGRLLPTLTAPLPADAVGEGATWERFEPVRLTLPKTNAPLTMGVRTRYTLKLIKRGRRERFARIRSDVTLKVRAVSGGASALRAGGGGQGNGELKVDLRYGTVVSAKSTITLEMWLRDAGRRRKLTQTTTTSTRAIKLKPLPPRPRPTGGGPGPEPVRRGGGQPG